MIMNRLFASIAFLCLFGGKMTAETKKQSRKIVADMMPLPNALEPIHVRSASDYVLLSHLVRPLVGLDARGRIVGDLAESWLPSKDLKNFSFEIKKSAKWNDGTAIVAADVVATLERQMRFNSAIHYDFSNIDSVVADGDHTVRISLKSADATFIRQTTSPEFGVLHKGDQNAPIDTVALKITSGPYGLESVENGSFKLVRNPHYDGFGASAPDVVQFQHSSLADQVAAIKNKTSDFIVPTGPLTHEIHKELEAHKDVAVFRPHIGFTYWISLHENSKALSQPDVRSWVQRVIHQDGFDLSKLGPQWATASQLYLPDGAGRPAEGEIQARWKNIYRTQRPKDAPKMLSMLCGHNFPFRSEVIAKLKKVRVDVVVETYSDQAEYAKKISEKDYDLVQTNNDLSSADLLQNLLVVFNESRPLVFAESIGNLLKQAMQSPDQSFKNKLFREIGMRLIDEGRVVPIAYFYMIFYHRADLDLSKWSILYPEVSFWKAVMR